MAHTQGPSQPLSLAISPPRPLPTPSVQARCLQCLALPDAPGNTPAARSRLTWAGPGRCTPLPPPPLHIPGCASPPGWLRQAAPPASAGCPNGGLSLSSAGPDCSLDVPGGTQDSVLTSQEAPARNSLAGGPHAPREAENRSPCRDGS